MRSTTYFCFYDTRADYYRDETLQLLGKSVKSAKIAKSLIGWDLEQLEALVLDAQVRSSDSDEDSDDDDI